MEVIRVSYAAVARRLSVAADGESPPGGAAGKGLAGLGSAVQIMVSFLVLLPIVGGVVLLVEYLTVSSIPPQLAFSESPGGLIWRGWLVLIGGLGPLAAVWLCGLQGGALKWGRASVLIATLALAVLTPFPHVAGPVVVMGALAAWFLWRLGKTEGPSVPAIALAVLLGASATAIALGLTPTGGQPVFVQSSNPAVISTGWYIQITDSADPIYLLTCSGDKVVALPKEYIQARTFGNARFWNVSILDIIESRSLPPFGLTPACPASQPPAS
jgi:hypothetical protein